MSMPIKPIILIGVLASLPAQAQLLGRGFESNITLTRQDLDILRETVTGKIHGQGVGATASWTNPASGNYGTIRLVRKFNSGALRCETVRYTLTTTRRNVAAEHYTFDSCLQPDGSWKIS
jgi:surface antigen